MDFESGWQNLNSWYRPQTNNLKGLLKDVLSQLFLCQCNCSSGHNIFNLIVRIINLYEAPAPAQEPRTGTLVSRTGPDY